MGNQLQAPKCCRKCNCFPFHKVWTPSREEFALSPLVTARGGADTTDSSDVGVPSVRTIDLCFEENGSHHNTDKFELMNIAREAATGELPNLVIRRGQPFKIKIALNRPFEPTIHAVSFIFTVLDDDKPSHGRGTLVGVVLDTDLNRLNDPYEWTAVIDSIDGDILTVLVKPSAAAPVTQWKMDVDTRVLGGESKSYTLPQAIYVLFNPWCTEDSVYNPDVSQLNEYVMADTTLVWRGSYNRMRPSIWKLGQFEKDVLDCALLLISKVGKVSASYRGDPIRAARALSAAVNSVDDNGAILGNWSEDFSGGTAPTKWVGSVAIMQQYYKKRKPVKYGQCWTFAGVLTTAARAVGIPSRLITCYSAAHDTQASLTVDYFVNAEGKPMEEMNSDSIWNYHVWNEVWMDRPDLGFSDYYGSYGGWQAVDATPQEMSDEMYRCGPASVLAVKLGETQRPYDNNFVYAEVNADKVFWKYAGPYQPLKMLKKDEVGIGHLISTKAIGKWERQDITSTYKFEEKTKEERNTMLKALKQSKSHFSRYYLNEDFNDVQFTFVLLDDIKIGQPFNVILIAKNRTEDTIHAVSGVLRVDSVMYTGNNREAVKAFSFDREIQPNDTTEIKMEVTFDDYFTKLHDQSGFNVSCMVTVRDTDYEYFAQDDFRVRKPDIKISFHGKLVSQEKITVNVRVENPLPIPLHKGVFNIEGPGIEKQLVLKVDEVEVGGFASTTFPYVPPYSGYGTFAAKFTSKEMDDVDGFLTFEVQPRPDDIITTPEENGNGFTNDIGNEI